MEKDTEINIYCTIIFLTLFIRTWHWVATCEGISSVSCYTGTDGPVVDDTTFCVHSASIATRILTFLINACFVFGTFRTYGTFRMASGW